MHSDESNGLVLCDLEFLEPSNVMLKQRGTTG